MACCFGGGKGNAPRPKSSRVAPEKEAGESSHGSGSEANLLRGKYDSFQDRNGAGSDAAGKGEDKASVSARTLDAELGLRDDPVGGGAGSFTERQGKSAQRETEEEALALQPLYQSPLEMSETLSKKLAESGLGDTVGRNKSHGKKRRPALSEEVLRRERAKADEAAGSTRLKLQAVPGAISAADRKLVEDSLKGNYLCQEVSQGVVSKLVDRMEQVMASPGQIIVQQGDTVTKDECFYVIVEGGADVLICPEEDLDEDGMPSADANQRMVHTMQPGTCFGEIAFLFRCPRSATVRASMAGSVRLFAVDRAAFHVLEVASPQIKTAQFVMDVPLFQNLFDNDLKMLAEHIHERTFKAGEKLVAMGAPCEMVWVVRSGEVDVVRPNLNNEMASVTKLGRTSFVGERSVLTGEPACADCVAIGEVVALAIKRDYFLAIMPLLEDYLESYVKFETLRQISLLKNMAEDQVSGMLDLFQEENFAKGAKIVDEGDRGNKLYLLRSGQVRCFKMDGGKERDLLVYRGYNFFGELALLNNAPRAATLTALTDVSTYSINRAGFNRLLGPLSRLLQRNDILGLLRKAPALKLMLDSELEKLLDVFKSAPFKEEEKIINQGDDGDRFYIVESGTVVITKAFEGESDPRELLRLEAGAQFGERALLYDEPRAANAIAGPGGCKCLYISRAEFELHLGSLRNIMDEHVKSLERMQTELPPEYKDLQVFRTVGCGQFGRVKMCKSKFSGKCYALKVMQKAAIVQLGQVEHVRNEKEVMEEFDSPFVVKLHRAFQSEKDLIMALELVHGGELFSYLDLEGTLRDSVACFYAANVVLSLEHIHSKGVVYRDLKPENLLIDKDGYLKIVDMGFAKKIATRTFTLCGTPDYQAPEIITRKGHDKAVDYWALGVLVYEMLVGESPFRHSDSDGVRAIFRRILDCNYNIPAHVSNNASDLIWNLLQTDPTQRLGYGRGGWRDVKRHKWFAQIDWAKLERRKVSAPWVPQLKDAGDVRYFEEYDEEDDAPGADGEPGEWPGWDHV